MGRGEGAPIAGAASGMERRPMFRQRLNIDTRGRGTHEITRQVQQVVEHSGVVEGLCHVFIHHTSASLIVCENADPTVRRDLETYAARLAPDGDPSYVHDSEGPDDMSAHIRSILTLPSLTVPVQRGPMRPRHLARDLPLGASDQPPPAADHRHGRRGRGRMRLIDAPFSKRNHPAGGTVPPTGWDVIPGPDGERRRLSCCPCRRSSSTSSTRSARAWR